MSRVFWRISEKLQKFLERGKYLFRALFGTALTNKILASYSELRAPNSQLFSWRRVGEEDGDRGEEEEEGDQEEGPTVGTG